MRRPVPTIKEQAQELEQKLHKEKDPSRKIRLHMLELLKNGKAKTRKQAAEHLAIHRNTVRLWLDLYESGGIEALVGIKPKGLALGQYSLPTEIVEELKNCLHQPAGFASYGEIQSWIQKSYGLEIKYKTLYRIVHYWPGAKLKVPRKSHVKKTLLR